MKIGVHVSSYTSPGGPQRLAQDLTRIAQAAGHHGFDKLSLMEHLWQITPNGPPEHEMLEAYTTLGYLAAQACNLFAGPDLPRKLDVLRAHCNTVGRDYHEITKTVSGPLDPGPGGQNVNALIGRMRELAKLGITHYRGPVPNVASITPLEVLSRRVIPVAAEL